MKVLVVGSGGREHALCWKLRQSPRVKKLFCAPGNAGTALEAENVALSSEDIPGLLAFARKEKVGLTVVGPEAPLTLGLVDAFEDEGIKCFGPRKNAAILEGSKAFSKELMARYGIPTARFGAFTDPDSARRFARELGSPLVVKADGLAAGKGVLLCASEVDADQAIAEVMEKRAFGAAGDMVVVEEFLRGEEASFLAFTDGKTVLPLASCQDHKAVFDGDRGPNTGGMGAYSPAPVVTNQVFHRVMEEVMLPTVRAMEKEGRPYKGVLYAGLMIQSGLPRVLEFNARFGDPETQPLLLRLDGDLLDIMEAVAEGRLADITLSWAPSASVCVVMASGGYPGGYEKGKAITGVERAEEIPGVKVFHAGTALRGKTLVTAGGRVLGVTARGTDLPEAVERAYRACGLIHWEGVHYRKDIGAKALGARATPG